MLPPNEFSIGRTALSTSHRSTAYSELNRRSINLKVREATNNYTPCSIQKNKNTKAQVTPTENQEEIQLAIRHIMVF